MSTFHFKPALINFVAAGCEKCIEVFAAEAEIREPAIRRGNYALHPPGLIADLNSHCRGHVQPAVTIHAQPIRIALLGSVRDVQPVEALLELQAAVGLNQVTVNPVSSIVSDVKQRLVWRQGDAVRVSETGINDSLFAVGLDEPDIAERDGIVGWRISYIDVTVVSDDDVVANEAFDAITVALPS